MAPRNSLIYCADPPNPPLPARPRSVIARVPFSSQVFLRFRIRHSTPDGIESPGIETQSLFLLQQGIVFIGTQTYLHRKSPILLRRGSNLRLGIPDAFRIQQAVSQARGPLAPI